jgi:hypothetical protein
MLLESIRILPGTSAEASDVNTGTAAPGQETVNPSLPKYDTDYDPLENLKKLRSTR